MYSNRTTSTECTNSQNPFGFHLSDGTVYNYLVGNEYEDIAAVWDWNLIPGTTVDYGATKFECSTTGNAGKEAFVGGASNGKVGVAAMRYTNPVTGSLSWQKSWFFFPDGAQKVLISSLESKTDSPVYSVLDQRRHDGPVYVNGHKLTSANATTPSVKTLWHANTGYVFDSPSGDLVEEGLTVTVNTGNRTGAWTVLGASLQPPTSADLFAAYIEHDDENLAVPISYSVYPAVSKDAFLALTIEDPAKIVTVANDDSTSAVYHATENVLSVVFWSPGGGSVTFAGSTMQSSAAVTLVVSFKDKTFTVADPSQTLSTVTLNFNSKGLSKKSVVVSFPSSTLGKSITQPLP